MNGVDEVMAMVSRKIDGLADIANALHPHSELSEQSIFILSELEKSGASSFIEIKFMGGAVYQFMETGGQFEPPEPRFIEDDLNVLVTVGFLILNFTSSGGRIFRITRQAVRFIDTTRLMS
jgi:hypothetical protein